MSTPVLPGGAPLWENIKGGTIKATLTAIKPSSAWLNPIGANGKRTTGKPHVWEEIIGDDRAAMEAHIQASLDWLANYDAYYSLNDWKYEVKWKG